MNPHHLPGIGDSLILVVDDVPKNVQVVGAMLHEAGYQVIPATSGHQALQRVAARAPDLVLLDVNMPGMDGFAVCDHLKADPATSHIPVIFLTAMTETQHVLDGLGRGAVDYITKPFNPPELLARVRTHVELKHSRDALAKASAQLRDANENLTSLNQEKDEFLGIAAHDLKNPLNNIKGFAQILLEDARLPATQREEYLDVIVTQCDRMSRLVGNLLDINAIESGKREIVLQPCSLADAAEGVVEAHKNSASRKGQTIRLERAQHVRNAMADPDTIIQVLDNLVSNAVKYSPLDSPITVRIAPAPNDRVRCEVVDHGPGITPEDRPRLFAKFARLGALPTGGEQSTGLGLSIVKRLVDSMGGSVSYQPTPGQGSTFVVELRAVPQ